jgi:hypothetical protein
MCFDHVSCYYSVQEDQGGSKIASNNTFRRYMYSKLEYTFTVLFVFGWNKVGEKRVTTLLHISDSLGVCNCRYL